MKNGILKKRKRIEQQNMAKNSLFHLYSTKFTTKWRKGKAKICLTINLPVDIIFIYKLNCDKNQMQDTTFKAKSKILENMIKMLCKRTAPPKKNVESHL